MSLPKPYRCSTCHGPHFTLTRDLRRYCRDCRPKMMKRFRAEYGDRYGLAERNRRWADRNPERKRQLRSESHFRLKMEVLKAYGGKCECCSESAPQFLTIDHINGGGGKHIRSVGNFYPWLKTNGFPRDGFRVLCWNCNLAKGALGYCHPGG